jgi:hypothetical protein
MGIGDTGTWSWPTLWAAVLVLVAAVVMGAWLGTRFE